MGYTKQNFSDGMTLCAEHLNHMEEGIESSVSFTEQELTEVQKEQARKNIGAEKESSSALDEAKLRRFAALFNDSGDVESFVFFTDPHLLNIQWSTVPTIQEHMQTYLGCMKEYYEATPTSFVLCGGDWIGAQDTKEQACFKLGMIDGFMRKNFHPYYPVFGNHDDNYQGVDVEGGASGTGTLTHETVRNLMFRENGNTYYSFKGQNTTFYAFDSGIDWPLTMTDFKWEQVDWFAKKLIEDDAEHSAIAIHIFSNGNYVAADLTSNVLTVAQAYNNKTTLTLNGISYDFTKATGRVEFMLAGHTHEDKVLMLNGIQVIITADLRAQKHTGHSPTFDLCLADYTNKKLYLERIGEGNSRRTVYLDEDRVDVDDGTDSGEDDSGEDTVDPAVNVVPTAKALTTDEILEGVGYADGYRLGNEVSVGFKTATSGYVLVGRFAIDTSVAQPVYIKGDVQWLENNNCRIAVFDGTKFVDELRYTHLNVAQLAEGYYRMDLPVLDETHGFCSSDPNVMMSGTHMAISLYGTGEGLVIRVGQPIEDEDTPEIGVTYTVNDEYPFLAGCNHVGDTSIDYNSSHRALILSTQSEYGAKAYTAKDGTTSNVVHYPMAIPTWATKIFITCPGIYASVTELMPTGAINYADHKESGWGSQLGSLSYTFSGNYAHFLMKFIKGDAFTTENAFEADYDASGISWYFE